MITNLDPEPTGGGKVADLNVGSAPAAAQDYKTFRAPPGGETLGDALMNLPNDIGAWASGWLNHLNFAASLAQLANLFTGSALHWLTFGLLGFKLLAMGGGLLAARRQVRGPISLVYFRVPEKTADPVVSFLRNLQAIEVRETKPDGQGNVLLGVPAYHSGRARRALEHLRQKAGLEYREL